MRERKDMQPSPITELGVIEAKSDWFKRPITMGDGNTGNSWNKSKSVLEDLDIAMKSGEAFPYAIAEGRDGVNIITVRYSGPTKNEGAYDNNSYWASKFELDKSRQEFEQKRYSTNDRFIQLQYYQKLAADIILPTKAKLSDPEKTAIEIVSLGEKLYNLYNEQKFTITRVLQPEQTDTVQGDKTGGGDSTGKGDPVPGRTVQRRPNRKATASKEVRPTDIPETEGSDSRVHVSTDD